MRGALEEVRPYLEQHGIYSRGRFGMWKYEVANTDHTLMQGVELVNSWLLGEPETTIGIKYESTLDGRLEISDVAEINKDLAAFPTPPPFDVDRGLTANGTPVMQWLCHSGLNQRWRIQDVGNGAMQLITTASRAGGTCISPTSAKLGGLASACASIRATNGKVRPCPTRVNGIPVKVGAVHFADEAGPLLQRLSVDPRLQIHPFALYVVDVDVFHFHSAKNPWNYARAWRRWRSSRGVCRALPW